MFRPQDRRSVGPLGAEDGDYFLFLRLEVDLPERLNVSIIDIDLFRGQHNYPAEFSASFSRKISIACGSSATRLDVPSAFFSPRGNTKTAFISYSIPRG
jgi:hypothetical protein